MAARPILYELFDDYGMDSMHQVDLVTASDQLEEP